MYGTTPPQHMAQVRQLGTLSLREAEAALKHATQGHQGLKEVRDIMEGVKLLTEYYEAKVAATIAALVYSQARRPEDRQRAEELADQALASYLMAADFFQKKLDPYYLRISGARLSEAGVYFPDLVQAEKEDRQQLAEIFKW